MTKGELEALLHGPWHVDRRASTRVVDECDATVASAGMASRSLEDAHAIAVFISAAPDMYEALKELWEDEKPHDRESVWGNGLAARIGAALAKAEGRA